MRLSTPCSRRNVMFMANALNVVAMMLMPAIPGTITSRFSWSPLKIAPKSVKNSSGRTKLKNAAVGLRQNIRRSRRYWRQARTAASATGRLLRGELQVDVLERRPRDRQVAQRLVAGQRGRSQLVQQRGGVVGLALLQLAGLVAPGDAIPRGGGGAEFAGRPYGEDRAALDDRHAVGERLRLVEIVRGQEDRLAQVGELADDLPRRAPRGGIEARGRLVEEHELGVAHQRQPEVQAPGLAARQSADLLVLLAAQAGELEHLVDVARCRIQAAPVLERLADRDVAIHAAALQDDPHPRAQVARALAGIEAEHRDDPARAFAVALEDLDGRGLAGAVGAQQAEHLAARDLDVDPPDGSEPPIVLVQVAHEDGGGIGHPRIVARALRWACIDIGSNTTRLLVAEPEDGALREVLSQRTFTRLLGHEGAIPDDKVRLVADTVASQVRLARECGAHDIRAVATAAIRGAANRDELCDAIHRASGVRVAVLSGDDEARLAFAGATRMLRRAPEGTVAVVDVGGGSSELVCGTVEGGVECSASFRVGSGYLADHYLRSDPPSAAELESVRSHVAGVFEGLEPPRSGAAYAVGGSATSLRRLIGAVLDHETLGRGIRVLSDAPCDEVARRFEIHPERVRVLPAGMLLLDAASTLLGAPLQIAGGGLREGVILERMGDFES